MAIKNSVTNGVFKQVTGTLLTKLGEIIKPLNPCADVFQRFASQFAHANTDVLPDIHTHEPSFSSGYK